MISTSVIIPAYNASTFIAKTLQSVFDQNVDDFEVIVVDDGSTDNTAEVVSQFPRVQYLFKPNGGQASARNMGIRVAQGEFVAFVDSDDLWQPNKLGLQMSLLKETGLHWSYTDALAFDSDTDQVAFAFRKAVSQYENNILEKLLIENFIVASTVMVRRSVFEVVGYFDESVLLRNREDWDMWLRIAAFYPVGLVKKPLTRYRVHRTSATDNEDQALNFVSQLAVIERALARHPEQLSCLRYQAIVEIYFRIGRRLAARGQISTARKLFVRAIHLSPKKPKPWIYWMGCLMGKPMLNGSIQIRRWLQK